MITGQPCKSPIPVEWVPSLIPPTPPPTQGQCTQTFSFICILISSHYRVIYLVTSSLTFNRLCIYSQYPSLWSVAGTALTPSGSASGSIAGGLTSQFLRGSSVSYSGLTSSLPVSSPSSMYDPSLTEAGVADAQFESSIARLTASWAPVAQSY